MGSQQKGNRRERELANKFSADGFAVIRAPASGSATPRELPDLFAGNANVLVAIEAKTTAADRIYVGKEEVTALEFFADSFRALPRIGARFDYEDWYFFAPRSLHETENNYRVTRDDLDDGTHYSDLLTQQHK